jgi:hypothetical protein
VSVLIWILAAIGAVWVLWQVGHSLQWLRAVQAVEKKLAALFRRKDELMFSERDLSDAEFAEQFEVMEKIAAGERVLDHLKGPNRF